jgi:hypothetical protein
MAVTILGASGEHSNWKRHWCVDLYCYLWLVYMGGGEEVMAWGILVALVMLIIALVVIDKNHDESDN